MEKPLDAAHLAGEGEQFFRKGKYHDAAAAYQQAERAFLLVGDPLKAAEMANNRSVALLQAGDAAGALAAVEGTEVIFADSNDQRRQGMALANRAAALEALDRNPEALETYQRASDLLKQAGENSYRSMVLQSISALQLRTGQQLQALASMDAALENKPKLTVKERLLKKLLSIPFNMLGRK